MTRIYKVKTKNVYLAITNWFRREYAGIEYTFDFYWYKANGQKIWGCFVSKNNKLWDYSHQATLEWFVHDLHYPQFPNNELKVQ